MATWGSQTWGYENWGTLGDASVTLSGIQLSSQLGSVVQDSKPGWGTQYWGAGEWGDLVSPEVLVTGNSLTTSITSVAAGTDFVFEATGIEINSTTGNATSGISQLIIPTSITLTSSINSAFGGELVVVEVTTTTADQWGSDTWGQGQWGVGDGISTRVGNTQISGEASVILANDNTKTIALAHVSIDTSVNPDVSGIELTSALGQEFAGPNIEVQVTTASSDPWGEEAWGQGHWGVGDGTSINIGSPLLIGNADVQVTGSGVTISEGTVDPAPDATVTGIGIAMSVGTGTVTAFANVSTTGVEGNFSIGTETITAEANVPVTGSQITSSSGQLEYEAKYSFTGSQATVSEGFAFGGELVIVEVTTASTQPWGEVGWGLGQWGQSVGTDIAQGGEEVAVPSVEVDVTGIQLSSNTGNETVIGTANVTVTGQELNASLGDEDAFTKVTVQVTGNSIGTIEIGDFLAGISILVEPTGVTATASTGIMSVNAWAVVDAGDEPTWTVVDIAA